MKNSILALMLMLFVGSLYAQSYSQKNEKTRAWNQLSLTDDQKSQMKTIRADSRDAVKSIRSSTLPKEEKRKNLTVLHQEIRRDVSVVLSDEQLIQWDEIQKRRKIEKRKNRKAMQELQLTADQKKQVKMVMHNHRASMKSMKSSGQSEQDKRAGRTALHQRTNEDLAHILSSQQMTQFEEIRKNRKGSHVRR